MMVVVNCAGCEGTGLVLKGVLCGARCSTCKGLGVLEVEGTTEVEEAYFDNLPIGWTRADGEAELRRQKIGAPVVVAVQKFWTPYRGG